MDEIRTGREREIFFFVLLFVSFFFFSRRIDHSRTNKWPHIIWGGEGGVPRHRFDDTLRFSVIHGYKLIPAARINDAQITRAAEIFNLEDTL